MVSNPFEGERRGNVDDLSAALPHHLRSDFARRHEDSTKVRRLDGVPFLSGLIDQRRGRHDPRVVDEDVDSVVQPDDCIDHVSPTNGGPHVRASSPLGRSILTTLAPRSARYIVAVGPAYEVERSMTLTPASGPRAGVVVPALWITAPGSLDTITGSPSARYIASRHLS
jgi:hypothetical protein